MMYSQNDPTYRGKRLGKSKLSVTGFGCFLMSLASLFDRDPMEIMKIPGAITDDGLVVSGAIAKACGGSALPIVKNVPGAVFPKGWCIAMTNAYAEQGFDTHFFCVNMDTKQQIDPLDFPAQPEPLTYPIVEFRPFTGVKLAVTQTWQEAAREWAKEKGIITTGWDAPDAPMSQVRVAAALKNMYENL